MVGPDDTSAVAAAAISGWYAAADSFEDTVELRDIRQNLLRTIGRSEMLALLPWMTLDGGTDGPVAAAWTASGRVLYILVVDDTTPGDGLGSDAVLRYDVPSNTLSVFARLNAFNNGGQFPHLSMVHHRGRLYIGTAGDGIKVYNATANLAAGTLATTIALPAGTKVTGLTVDREQNFLFASSDSGVWRSSLGAFPTISFTQIAAGADIRALAWADHYGAASGPSQRGLYLLNGGTFPTPSTIRWLTATQAAGASLVTPVTYRTMSSECHDLCATADGKILIAADEDAVLLSDSADLRLGFDAWMNDEFQQHVNFARGLISPDGEPAGWVIDADVDGTTQPNRFHPATPDAAAWAVFALLMSDHLNSDPLAQSDIRSIITRYGDEAPDLIMPSRSADGIFRHWINPQNGSFKPGWDPEFATLSTMKIVAAAARAMKYYPNDAAIAKAGSRIIFGTRNWQTYLNNPSIFGVDDWLSFKGLPAGGADWNSSSPPFFEGIIFVEQIGVYGTTAADAAVTRWFNRSLWPTATFLTGRPITSSSSGSFGSAFISLYGPLLSKPYRNDLSANGWRTQVSNIRWSSAAWTDDNSPRHYTVFSAGTNQVGYSADSLGNRPGNFTTFTSLEALCAFGDTPEAVAAYAAYRKGARQTWKNGASLLYRRSDTDPFYSPNSAGLPDVTLGGLGLAELIQPGSINAVLAIDYPTVELCPTDLNADGLINIEDLYRHIAAPTDLNGDMTITSRDAACLIAWLRRNEAVETSAR